MIRVSKAVCSSVIIETEFQLYSELVQGRLASGHIFGRPLVVFLDEELFVSLAALLASLFHLVRASPFLRHATKIAVYKCTFLTTLIDINKGYSYLPRNIAGERHACRAVCPVLC